LNGFTVEHPQRVASSQNLRPCAWQRSIKSVVPYAVDAKVEQSFAGAKITSIIAGMLIARRSWGLWQRRKTQ
jgi:hypothetical protein